MRIRVDVILSLALLALAYSLLGGPSWRNFAALTLSGVAGGIIGRQN